MSHIHLPDGVLHPFLWISGYIVCLAAMWLLAHKLKGSEIRRKIPFVGVVGALMLIFMSVPLGIIPVHLSLAVLCGILAGPALGFIAAFVVNVILALMGHGGITVVGINTLLLGSEVILGFFIYKALLQKTGSTFSAVIANVLALLVSTALMITLVGSSAGLTEALPGHSHTDEPARIHLAEEQVKDVHSDAGSHDEDPHSEKSVESVQYLAFSGWTAVIIILLAGIFIESLITGLIVRFFAKVRPDLVGYEIRDTSYE
jgi:cobalt/nickel transport system permease protein